MQVKPLDLTSQQYIFDGVEPDDWSKPISISFEKKDWYFTLAELIKNPLRNLRLFLGDAAFNKIIQAQDTQLLSHEFQIYIDGSGLELYYFFIDRDSSDNQVLILISFGEFQPARYIAHLVGIWEIEN